MSKLWKRLFQETHLKAWACGECTSPLSAVTMFLFSDQGDVIVSILIDLNSFWTYENREVLSSDLEGSSEATRAASAWCRSAMMV